MNAAVTGAAGHVGGNLVRALLARGDVVRVLVRNDDRAVRGLDVTVVRGDAPRPVPRRLGTNLGSSPRVPEGAPPGPR